MLKKEITIDSWLKLTASGADIPAHTVLDGISMEPLIRRGKDTVTVMPLHREPKRGDIVLFKRNDGANVVHRVLQTAGTQVITLGDNCITPDAPLQRDQVLGIVTEIQRDDRKINPYDALHARYGEYRLQTVWIRKIKARCKNIIRKTAGQLLKGRST